MYTNTTCAHHVRIPPLLLPTTPLTRRVSQVSASDYFESSIYFREQKNKKQVSFYFCLFENRWCPPPIALVFG